MPALQRYESQDIYAHGLQRYDAESQDTGTVYKDMSAKICPVMQRYESQDIPGLQRYES